MELAPSPAAKPQEWENILKAQTASPVQINNKDIKQYWLQYPSLRAASSHQQPAGLFTVDHKLLSPVVVTHLIKSASLSVPWRPRELKVWKWAEHSNWQPCHREAHSIIQSMSLQLRPRIAHWASSFCLQRPGCRTKTMPFPISAVRWGG